MLSLGEPPEPPGVRDRLAFDRATAGEPSFNTVPHPSAEPQGSPATACVAFSESPDSSETELPYLRSGGNVVFLGDGPLGGNQESCFCHVKSLQASAGSSAQLGCSGPQNAPPLRRAGLEQLS